MFGREQGKNALNSSAKNAVTSYYNDIRNMSKALLSDAALAKHRKAYVRWPHEKRVISSK